MDNDGLKKNDPFRNMNTGKDTIRPGFLGGDSSGEVPGAAVGDSDAERKKKSNRAPENLKSAERNASRGESGSAGDVNGVRQSEKKAGGFYSGTGKQVGQKDTSPKKFKGLFKSSASIFSVGIILIIVVVIGAMSAPSLLIGGVDFNLMRSLGFEGTVAILEMQGEHAVKEMLGNGEFPSGFASDLAARGVEVGQVTLAGEFVRTNSYIADLGTERSIATTGEYHNNGPEGELVIQFKDQIINAENIVAKIESDPELYAAYSEAADISARYYYGEDVSTVIKDEMGISRNNFYDWKDTSNSEENQKTFEETLVKVLDKNTSLEVVGCVGGEASEDRECGSSASVSGDAGGIISDVASKVNSKDNAAQLLNSALSASEPYKGASAFMVVEEVLQRARIGDNGPVNEMMNVLSKQSEVSYVDVNTGESKTKKASILETVNFSAAASGGGYSKSEANNFSRDRILRATNTNDRGVIANTTVGSRGQSSSSAAIFQTDFGQTSADGLSGAASSLTIGITEKNSDLFSSVVGGNRIVEGGSFANNMINQRVLGSMPSDASTIAEYHHEVKDALARRAEADRTTLSPFDISSPHTFLGSIVNKGASLMIKNYGTLNGGGIVMPAAQAISSWTSSSVNGLFGGAIADGNDEAFTTLSGDGCQTVQSAANVEGDIYCTAHTTSPTKYVSNTMNDWKNALGGNLNSSGKVENKSELANFAILGKNRTATVGVKNADICEAYKKEVNTDVVQDALDFLGGLAGVYNSCDRVDDSIAFGSRYTLSNSNGNKGQIELYSGFVLYDTVYSLLSEKKSAMSEFEEEYYAKYPKDNSPAGRIARISGMSKKEAQIALDYASYLSYIAKYNPSTRFAFGKPAVEIRDGIKIESDNWIAGEGILLAGIVYRGERNRSFAA